MLKSVIYRRKFLSCYSKISKCVRRCNLVVRRKSRLNEKYVVSAKRFGGYNRLSSSFESTGAD